MSSPRFAAPLRHPVFARYMAGEFVSMIGTWMQIFAQGWVLTGLTESAFILGALNFTSGLPMLLLSLIGGRAADRYDKRLILLATLVVQVVSALSIGWLIQHGQIRIWHIFVAAGFVGLATAFEVPAVSAFVPELVPKEEMAGAIAIDRASFHATRLIGPSVGGYITGRFGDAAAYFINAASFLALASALMTTKQRRLTGVSKEEAQQGGIGAGLAYVKQDEPTRAMILLMAAMTTFVSPFVIITMPIYARHVLELPANQMGLLMAISGVGSLLGSTALLAIPHGKRALFLKLAATAIVVAVGGMAAAHSFVFASAALILLTIGLSITFGTGNIVIQERAPDEMRGRISSVAAMAYFGVVPFSGLLISQSIDLFGMRPTLVGGGCGYGLVAAWLLFGRKRLASVPAAS